MGSHTPGIPMEGLIPADKLSAPSTKSTTALRSYIPALDGVRGLAIIVVMFCHFSWMAPVAEQVPPPSKYASLMVELFKTGRYGVDLFFVLSGFLITGILFDAKHDKHYFRNFYARRTLRIFPLYYAVLLIMFVIVPLLFSLNSPGDRQMLQSQGWLWLYLSNMKSAFVHPEFWHGDRLWVGHFWSLAIEEQFYLVWPLVILLLSRGAAMVLCVGLVMAAPLIRAGLFLSLQPSGDALAAGAPPAGTFALLYFTLSKIDTLALGALLALAARSEQGIVRYAKLAPYMFVLLGMLLAPLLFWKYPKVGLVGALGETAKLSVICLFCGSLLVMAVNSTPKQWFGWFFTLPIMRFFGKYSYALYIFHELLAPLFNGPLGTESLALRYGVNWYIAFFAHLLFAGLISVALALLSWNLLEKHMLKLKRFFEHAPEPRQAAAVSDRAPAPVAIAGAGGHLAG